jgi:hypothetical protein
MKLVATNDHPGMQSLLKNDDYVMYEYKTRQCSRVSTHVIN